MYVCICRQEMPCSPPFHREGVDFFGVKSCMASCMAQIIEAMKLVLTRDDARSASHGTQFRMAKTDDTAS